jgi:hypothetical protein
MSRVVNPNGPGKSRDYARRTIAEILRHLIRKRSWDDEARDMASAVVLALEDIAASVEVTTEAWEKRDYFLKADRFRLEWEWAGPASRQLAEIVTNDRWNQLPAVLAALAPRFSDIRILKMTRAADTWLGQYRALCDRS